MAVAGFRWWAETHPGTRRTHNEDCYVARPEIGLWAVADGAGGHAHGEMASRMICDRLGRITAASAGVLLAELRNALQEVHAALRQTAQGLAPGAMIASTVVALLASDRRYTVVWAGDSRLYLIRGGKMSQVTRDHSLVQVLVESGTVRAEEAERHPQANVITRAVGADVDQLELDSTAGPIRPADRFLLCSDGLSKSLDIPEIQRIACETGAASPATSLIGAALARRARDNVTAVVVEAASGPG